MVTREGLRARLGEALLVLLLVANFGFGALLYLALRADMARELLESEKARVSTKVGEYLWGKVVLFASAVGEDGRPRGGRGMPPGVVGLPSFSDRLTPEARFRRVRSGAGEWLPVYVGAPVENASNGAVLPVALRIGGNAPLPERFVVGVMSLGDLAGYLEEQRRQGILCRLVDASGQRLLGERAPFSPEGDDAGMARALDTTLPGMWSLQVRIPDAASRLPVLPQALLWCVVLGNALALLFLRRRFLVPYRRAVRSVRETLVEHGERLPSRAEPATVAERVKSRLERHRGEMEEEKRRLAAASEKQVAEMTQAHRNMVLHHKITKRMLQALAVDEVFDTLSVGVSEGYGFPGAIAGRVAQDGHMVFPGEADRVTGAPVRIPLWDPRSLLTRTFWGGANAILPRPQELPHLPEELAVVGNAPAYVMPVIRAPKIRCAEVRNCGDRSCPMFSSENLKCWMRQVPAGEFHPGSDPESFREGVIECLNCEMFPAAGVIVVREMPGGKAVTRESVHSISSLSSEAALAMEVVALYDHMKIMAVTDGLTGLFNHREFYQALRRELERSRRYRHPLSLLIIDVDDFKQFNDRYGHPAGDSALRRIADLLRKCARATDTLARYGGEEFAVILPESPPSGALMVAERIKTEVCGYNFIPNAKYPVYLTVSIGIYTTEDGGVSEDQMVSLADEAAYNAKNAGKNRVVVKAAF
jgi:diguanylate cyclase (GGDEF)-like protein